MSATDVAGPAFWRRYWQRQPAEQQDWTVPWMPLLDEHLPIGPQYRALEIGCVPGRVMQAFHDRFGYRMWGIDYSELIDDLRDDFARRGLEQFTFERADLREYQPAELFDVVLSIGVIEHFHDFEDMVSHHCRLTAPGGYVHISMPNFRGLQYWLRRWLCPEALEGHHLPAMNARKIRRRFEREGFEVMYCGGWGTFHFWFPPGLDVAPRRRQLTNWYVHRTKQMLARLHLDNFPTWWASPHLICLARRPR